MRLYEALKRVVESEGSSILTNKMLINFLQDYQAFNEEVASKHIIKTMQDEGFLEKIQFTYDNNSAWETKMQNYSSELKTTYGFKDSIVDYSIDSVKCALGWISEMPQPSVPNNSTKDNEEIHNIEDYEPTGEHFTFKGVEIDGNPDRMVRALENKGFRVTERTYEGIAMTGNFAGVNDRQIYISISPIAKLASNIIVILGNNNNWWGAKNIYQGFKDTLTKKYGRPDCYETFDSPYYEGDGYEFTALNAGSGRYFCTFNTSLGKITMMINSNGTVFASYEDKKIKEQIDNGISLCEEADL